MSGPVPPVSERAQIVRDVTQFLTTALMIYVAGVSTNNGSKMEDVERRQREVVIRQDDAAQRAEVVRTVLEAKVEEDLRQRGVQLYSTWKYLEDVAAASGSRRDIEKAAEAKKLYESHLKKER